MELTHRFTVPASRQVTWDAFNDIESVAGCFPGATVTSVEGDDFSGTCKVKLGPIALVYSGTGTFVEKDEAAGRFVMAAKGKDKRGNGTAGADVTVTLAAADDDACDVVVVTDLNITGKPAQFGRGVMQDVSDKLLNQFVACLEDRLQAPEPAPADAAATSAEPTPSPAAAHAPQATAPAELSKVPPDDADDDALDLGATVLPVLAKAYWKQAVGALVVLLLLRRLLRRR